MESSNFGIKLKPESYLWSVLDDACLFFQNPNLKPVSQDRLMLAGPAECGGIVGLSYQLSKKDAFSAMTQPIELLNNKSHVLSFSGGFASLFFDQVVPYYSQRHLADRNVIYILHR